MAPAFEHIEVEHRPVACWQLSHHPLYHLGRYLLDGRIIFFCHIVKVFAVYRQLVAAVVPDEVQRLVHGNPRGPCPEGALPLIAEALNVCDDADKCVLQHVAGIF